MRNKFIALIILLNLASTAILAQQKLLMNISGSPVKTGIPSVIDSAENTLTFSHDVNIKKINAHLFHVRVNILPGKEMQPASIDIPLTIEVNSIEEVQKAKKNFHWLPNIKSSPEQVISQHVFRSPCIILTIKNNSLVFIPDVVAIKNNSIAPYYMDLQYGQKNITLHYGLSNYDVASHQYYKKNNKPFSLSSKLEMSFYILLSPGNDPLTALKAANNFLWTHFAKEYTNSYLPQTVPFDKYATTGYEMALKHYWVNAGIDKGGITLSTFYDTLTKTYRGRESKDDLWYQSWFNNIRTAYGLYGWGKMLHNNEWQQKALACTNLLADVPRHE
ncbi:MAG: hypothetical protein ABUT20_22975, partial [Bacteroidota bacterium]